MEEKHQLYTIYSPERFRKIMSDDMKDRVTITNFTLHKGPITVLVKNENASEFEKWMKTRDIDFNKENPNKL